MARAWVTGLATLVVLVVLARGAFEGGSILGVLLVLVAGLVATGTGALARPQQAAPAGRPTRLPRKQVAVGMLGAIGAFLAGVVLWWMAFATATGCAFHCNIEDRSPVVATVLTAASMAAWAAAGRLVGWSLSLRRRHALVLAAGGALLAFAAVATTVSSFMLS